MYCEISKKLLDRNIFYQSWHKDRCLFHRLVALKNPTLKKGNLSRSLLNAWKTRNKQKPMHNELTCHLSHTHSRRTVRCFEADPLALYHWYLAVKLLTSKCWALHWFHGSTVVQVPCLLVNFYIQCICNIKQTLFLPITFISVP